ncbi:MAG TPA: YegP family protein [Candidatus Limnocylindria bacterium]
MLKSRRGGLTWQTRRSSRSLRTKPTPANSAFASAQRTGEIVAQSEAYSSKDSAKNGIRVIRTEAAGAIDQDLT